jgi:hypothetical protein
MIKSKNLLIKQGSVYGAKSPVKDDRRWCSVPSAVMNLKNTQNKRRKIVQDAKLNNFRPECKTSNLENLKTWQRRVFAKERKERVAILSA